MKKICKQTRETLASLKKVIKFVHLKHDITKHNGSFSVKVRENCKTTVNSINYKQLTKPLKKTFFIYAHYLFSCREWWKYLRSKQNESSD
jgi:hypothetical protein